MMGWLGGYTTRKKITIDHTKVDSALVNFPVFVKLRSTNFDFALTTDAGNDIRFTAANGVSLLAFERDRHDKTNQRAEYQVRIPSVSNSVPTEFYIYFKDDPSIVDGSNPTGVWDTSFKGRWSLDEDPTAIAPQMRDSTVNANHGTTHGGMTSARSVEGKIGRALDFDGMNDYVDTPLQITPGTSHTILFWAKFSDPTIHGQTLSFQGDWQLGIHYNHLGNGVIRFHTADTSITLLMSDYTWVGDTNWHLIGGIYDGSQVHIIFDGVIYTPTQSTVVNRGPFNVGFKIARGVPIDNLNNFKGLIDEIRISNTVRSAAWIKASYNSSKNTLVTISATESNLINRSAAVIPQAAVLVTRNIEGILKSRSVSATPQATVLPTRSVEGILKFRSTSATPQALINRKPLTRWVGWLSGYTTRKKIIIDQTKVDSALVNFPVFVKLRSANFDFALTTDAGNDIRFTAANGVSPLDFERDRHDKTNQRAEYQVRIPNVSNSTPTEFYIYFKNDPSIVDGSNPTGVWDVSFKGRWSLDEDPTGTAPQMRDSTMNANHGTTHGAMTSTQSVEGRIVRALDFDGVNDHVDTPLQITPGTSHTILFWAKFSDPTIHCQTLSVQGDWQLGIHYNHLGNGVIRFHTADTPTTLLLGDYAWVGDTNWHLIGGIYDGSQVHIIFDGVIYTPTQSTVVNRGPFNVGLKIARGVPIDNLINFKGLIDEVRISSTVRSAAWIKASYNSNKDTLVTISVTESNILEFRSVAVTPQVTVPATRNVSIPRFRSVAVTPQAMVLATRNVSIPKSRSVSATPQALIDRKPRTRQMFRSVSATPQALIDRKSRTRQMFRSVSATPQALIDRKSHTRQMFRSVAVTPRVLIDRKPLPRQMFRSVAVTPRANIIYVFDDTMAALMRLPTRTSSAKLSIWFDGPGQPATVFTDDHIKSIRLLHELNDGIVVGELSISLLNQNFKLTPSNPDSPFFNRFKPGLKIKAELGIHGPARIEWTQLGTYYLDSWNAPATTSTLSLVAYDQLFRLLESKVLLGKQPAKANTTAQIMLSEALSAVGITNPDLTAMQPDIPIDIGWFTEDSLVQQVSLLLASGDFIAFVDRTADRVRIIPEGFSIQKRVYRFDSSTVFEAHNPQDYAGARSIVEYSFSRPTVKPFEEVWSGAELQQGTHVGLELTAPVAMLEFSRQKGVADWTMDAGVTHFDITVLSSIPLLKLFGYPIKDYPELVVATNPFAVQQYGKRVLRKVNRFVQNRTLATQLAEKQLARVSDHTNSFRFVASGQPALSFDHLVRLKIPEHRVDVDTLVLTKTETVYDGGLRLRAEGRRLV